MDRYDGYVRIKYELDISLESTMAVRERLQELRRYLISTEGAWGSSYWFWLLEVEDMLNMQLKRVG